MGSDLEFRKAKIPPELWPEWTRRNGEKPISTEVDPHPEWVKVVVREPEKKIVEERPRVRPVARPW